MWRPLRSLSYSLLIAQIQAEPNMWGNDSYHLENSEITLGRSDSDLVSSDDSVFSDSPWNESKNDSQITKLSDRLSVHNTFGAASESTASHPESSLFLNFPAFKPPAENLDFLGRASTLDVSRDAPKAQISPGSSNLWADSPTWVVNTLSLDEVRYTRTNTSSTLERTWEPFRKSSDESGNSTKSVPMRRSNSGRITPRTAHSSSPVGHSPHNNGFQLFMYPPPQKQHRRSRTGNDPQDIAMNPNFRGRQHTRSISEYVSSEDIDPTDPHVPKHVLLYKTELCRVYARSGECKYGDNCHFAHGMAELRKAKKHPKYKTEMCKMYHEQGKCTFGSQCAFIHNEDGRQLNAIHSTVGQSSQMDIPLVNRHPDKPAKAIERPFRYIKDYAYPQ